MNLDEVKNWLESIKDRVQPKQEWNKEDEEKIMWLVRLISTAGYRELDNDKMPCSRSELIDWLKSIKDKMQPQPKQEWSEEDEKMLDNCIGLIQEIDSTQEEQNWLNSLKDRVQPQPKQEWSEKDNERIERIYHFIWKNRKGDTSEIYQQEQDAEWLKSLKPNHWKPSEQNIKDLEWCADLVQDKLGVGFHRLQVFIDEIKNL